MLVQLCSFLGATAYKYDMKTKNLPIYRVKKGDTLKSIAIKYGVNPTQILVENAITPSQIREGFIISITKKED